MFLRSRFVVYCFIIALAILIGCGNRINKNENAPILLFNGTGISPNDVSALHEILDNNHLEYTTANSAELNAMSELQLRKHRLLIIPGGNFIDMGKSLSPKTAVNIRSAVQQGLNYFGICAGAFLAGNSAYYNGFNLTSGVTFGFYSAANKGVRKTNVTISNPDGTTLDQYWEDGPQLSGWCDVVAKYPDDTPAVVEGKFGKGFVMLSGIHAEAPEYWRGNLIFNTPVSTDNAYAAKLIMAALKGVALPHY